jgi:hypothetical protein
VYKTQLPHDAFREEEKPTPENKMHGEEKQPAPENLTSSNSRYNVTKA